MEEIDPTLALFHFQEVYDTKGIDMQPGALDADLYVSVDDANGQLRFSYVRFDNHTVTVIVLFVAVESIKGTPCFQIAYAVHPNYRGAGLCKNTVNAAIEELKTGSRELGWPPLHVEAIVGIDKTISQRIAASCISPDPTNIIDQFTKKPSLQYIRLLE
jgi:hypothetical protein